MNNRKAQCRESGTLRLAEGPTEKGCNRSTSLAAYSTRKIACGAESSGLLVTASETSCGEAGTERSSDGV
jgi:hypothetical protein